MKKTILVAMSIFSMNAFAQSACEDFSGSYIAGETVSGGGQFSKGKDLKLEQTGCDSLTIKQSSLVKEGEENLTTLQCDGKEHIVLSSDGSDVGNLQSCSIKRDQVTVTLRRGNSGDYVESILIKLGNGKVFYRSISVNTEGKTVAEQVNVFEKP